MSTYLLGSLGRAQNRDFEEFRLSGFYWIQTSKRLSYDKNDFVMSIKLDPLKLMNVTGITVKLICI